MSYISQNIKSLRKRYSWTQEDLAKKLDIKRPLVGAWEEGKSNPRYDVLRKIVDVFHLKLDDPTMLITDEIRPGEIPRRKPNPRDEQLWKDIEDIRKILNSLPQ